MTNKRERLKMEADMLKAAREILDLQVRAINDRVNFTMAILGVIFIGVMGFCYLFDRIQARDEYLLRVMECMTEYHESNPNTWLTDREKYEICSMREQRTDT